MYKLYEPIYFYKVTLINNEEIELHISKKMRFGEVPETKVYETEDMSQDNVLIGVFDLDVKTGLFTKNRYIELWTVEGIFKYNVKFIKTLTLEIRNEELETSDYSVPYLQHSLSFDDYTLLLLEREKTLKELLNII